MGMGEVLGTDLKGEAAFFYRKNKVSTSLGCPTGDIHDSTLEVYSLLHNICRNSWEGLAVP